MVMTVKLSRLKANKIMRLYFRGLRQASIAERTGSHQSTISLYSSRFKEIANSEGLLNAGKEFGVENEVEALRSLSVEMYNAELTVADAEQGVAIIKIFHRMDVEPEQHDLLIKVCKEVRDPDFVKAAMELTNIESTTRMNFHQAIERLQEVSTQLPPLEDRLQNRETQLYSINSMIKERQRDLENLDKTLTQSRETSEKTIREREMELSRKMNQLNIRETEINAAVELQRYLADQELDIPTLVKLAKEFKK